MINLILIILLVLWLLGYLQIPLLHSVIFRLFGRSITLNDILVVFVVIWLINLLPSPFRGIAIIILILWLLKAFGIIVVYGLGNIILLALIIALVVFLLGGHK